MLKKIVPITFIHLTIIIPNLLNLFPDQLVKKKCSLGISDCLESTKF